MRSNLVQPLHDGGDGIGRVGHSSSGRVVDGRLCLRRAGGQTRGSCWTGPAAGRFVDICVGHPSPRWGARELPDAGPVGRLLNWDC